MRMIRMSCVVAMAVAVLVGSTLADRVSVSIPASALSTQTAATAGLGNYYVLDLPVPPGLSAGDVDHAFLEFVVDVAARNVAGYEDDAPVFEVYALSGSFAGPLSASEFVSTTIPMVRNVAVGENRRVVIDVTEAVKLYLATPSANHGLVLGSLTGRRDGLFTIRSNVTGMAGAAKLTVFTQ